MQFYYPTAFGYYIDHFGACAQFMIQTDRLLPFATIVLIALMVCLTVVYVVRKQSRGEDNA